MIHQTRLLMGMPITVAVVDSSATAALLDEVYAYFQWVDETFSTYKSTSEIMRINRGELELSAAHPDVQQIFALAEQTRLETDGYFDIRRHGFIDPSGIVKGWAIRNAGDILRTRGFNDFYVDAGGDIEVSGLNDRHEVWRVGIRNPFSVNQFVKTLVLTDCGVATSGTSIRGQHIYNPHQPDAALEEVVSLTVIGPDVYEADRFATAAFAMGPAGIAFIESLPGFEGYQIDRSGQATLTSGLSAYLAQPTAEAH